MITSLTEKARAHWEIASSSELWGSYCRDRCVPFPSWHAEEEAVSACDFPLKHPSTFACLSTVISNADKQRKCCSCPHPFIFMASHPKETSTGLLSVDGCGCGAADAVQLGSAPAVVLLFVLPWEPLRLLSGGTQPMHGRDALARVPCSRDKRPCPDGTGLSQVGLPRRLPDTGDAMCLPSRQLP